MLFFGGFGVQVGRESYMIPVDAKIWKEGDVRRQGVSIESVLDAMKEKGAKAKLVVVDASRRNPYERRFRAYSHGLAPISAPDNALILSSATPGKVADDSKGQHSVLMTELLEPPQRARRRHRDRLQQNPRRHLPRLATASRCRACRRRCWKTCASPRPTRPEAKRQPSVVCARRDILTTSSFRGARSASPESISRGVWIPGLRQAAHPGMTN